MGSPGCEVLTTIQDTWWRHNLAIRSWKSRGISLTSPPQMVNHDLRCFRSLIFLHSFWILSWFDSSLHWWGCIQWHANVVRKLCPHECRLNGKVIEVNGEIVRCHCHVWKPEGKNHSPFPIFVVEVQIAPFRPLRGFRDGLVSWAERLDCVPAW